jgi:hypothetical protein
MAQHNAREVKTVRNVTGYVHRPGRMRGQRWLTGYQATNPWETPPIIERAAIHFRNLFPI